MRYNIQKRAKNINIRFRDYHVRAFSLSTLAVSAPWLGTTLASFLAPGGLRALWGLHIDWLADVHSQGSNFSEQTHSAGDLVNIQILVQ